MKQPEIYPSTLPPLKPRPPIEDHSAEGTFILLFDQAVELATMLNAGAIAVYLKQCEFWQLNAPRYQAAKIALPSKPESPSAYTVKVLDTGEPRAWFNGSDKLAGPCPDVEPDGAVIFPAPLDPVGEWYGGADPWYRVVRGDTTPIGRTVTSTGGIGHLSGTYARRERVTPFGAFQYWEKL